MNPMRLSIFAQHVASIMGNKAPDHFVLSPCDGVLADVVIEPTKSDLVGDVWDEVTINGVACGNRIGGIQYFTQLVNLVKPKIAYD
jgi:hypothetical protein